MTEKEEKMCYVEDNKDHKVIWYWSPSDQWTKSLFAPSICVTIIYIYLDIFRQF